MPAIAATTAPLLSVLRRLEVTPVIAKVVVVALVVVALSAKMLPKVEDALVRTPPERVERPVTPRVEVKEFAALKVLVVAREQRTTFSL